MVDFARHTARKIRQEVHAGIAHLVDGHSAAQRRIVFIPLEDVAEVSDAGRGQRFNGAS